MTRYRYRHHGFQLDANQPLPRLAPVDTPTTDIRVEVLDPGEVVHHDLPWVMPDPPVTLWRAETEAGTLLRLRYATVADWAEYVVDADGATVWVSRSEQVPLEEASELLLGPVFSCVLAQRGLTCVHAAVVAVEGRVIALPGASGTGKSTAATAFVAGGATLISDDVAVLTDRGGRVAVHAGAPRVRLHPEAADALSVPSDLLEPMWVREQWRAAKRYLPMADESLVGETGPFALDGLYFLGARSAATDDPELHPLTPRQTLAKLMVLRHMAGALGPANHRRDFEVLAGLAETVPARELLRPDRLDALPATLGLISSDVRSLA